MLALKALKSSPHTVINLGHNTSGVQLVADFLENSLCSVWQHGSVSKGLTLKTQELDYDPQNTHLKKPGIVVHSGNHNAEETER